MELAKRIGNKIHLSDISSSALPLLESLSKKAVEGIPSAGIMSAQKLAELYINDGSYASNDARVDTLIFHEAVKCSIPGFITGLGGLSFLPIAIPSDMLSTWVIEARMVAAIAIIYGDYQDDKAVWTTIFACMIGEQAANVFRESAIDVAQKLTAKEISKISGEALTKINEKIGIRLITKYGEKGVINLGKLVPFVGGPISATIDFFFCYSIGLVAKRVFGPEKADFGKVKLLKDAKQIIEEATKTTYRISKKAAVKKIEERRQKKEIESLVHSLQNLLELDADCDGKTVAHRKEMLLEKGPDARECLIVHAIKGNEAFRGIAKEILVELCEPEDEIITKHLNRLSP